jgi:Flp pilus assembly protein TadD
MAKPMLVTLPLLLLLLDYWPLNRLGNRAVLAIIEKMPFFVLAAVSSVITFVVQQSGGAVINASPLKDRIANAFLSYAEYIGKMFRPQDLAIFYPFDAGSIISWQVAMCVLLLLAISILVIRFGRRQKYLPVGWFWFVVTLVPVIGFVQVGSQAIADRYTYMPYIGLFIMLAWGLPELLSKLPQRKIALGLSMAMALTVLGIVAHRQASYWNDSITLFSHATLVTQNNYLAHNNRGAAYGKTGRWQEAIEDFREAVKIKPDDAETYNNLGAAYESLGRGTEAIAAYKQAIRIKPDHAETYCALGRVYGELGRSAEAIEAYRQAIMLKPDNAEAYNDLGIAYVRLGRGAEAMEAFRLAMKIEPDNAQMLNNLAWLIATGPDIRNRDTNEAIRLAKGACELTNYKNPVFLCTLAAAYASAGKFSEAVDTAKKAMDLADAANQPQVRNIIGQHLSLYKQGKPYIEPSPQSPPEGNKP